MKLPQHILDLNPELAGLGEVSVKSLGGYKSKLEKMVAQEWIPTKNPWRWMYEPITFHLPGGNYTPDFGLIFKGLGPVPIYHFTLVESKGWTQSIRADRRAFKEAAGTYPWFTWIWLTWQKNLGWKEDVLVTYD